MNYSTYTHINKSDLQNIKKGEHVKINTCNEIFWCKVTQNKTDLKIIFAVVDNDLIYTAAHGLRCGDKVEILYSEVHSILKKGD